MAKRNQMVSNKSFGGYREVVEDDNNRGLTKVRILRIQTQKVSQSSDIVVMSEDSLSQEPNIRRMVYEF